MALKCPRSDGGMSPRLVDDVEYDRCGNCRGLWFDAFEHEALKASPEAANVDTGPPSTRTGESCVTPSADWAEAYGLMNSAGTAMAAAREVVSVFSEYESWGFKPASPILNSNDSCFFQRLRF